MIGEEFCILPDHSSFMSKIFDKDNLSRKDAVELLFENSNLSKDEQDKVRISVFSCPSDDILAFEANSHNLVSEIVIKHSAASS